MNPYGYDRRAQKEQRPFCVISGKVCFDKKSAATAKNSRYHEDHTELRIYPCNHCSAWHLTSQLRLSTDA